jgi:hypothetical protein
MAKRRNVSGRVLRNAVPQPRDVAEFVAPRTVNEGLSIKNVFGDAGDMIDPFITAAIEKQEGLRDVSDDELKMLAILGSIPVAGAVAGKAAKTLNKLVPNPKGGFIRNPAYKGPMTKAQKEATDQAIKEWNKQVKTNAQMYKPTPLALPAEANYEQGRLNKINDFISNQYKFTPKISDVMGFPKYNKDIVTQAILPETINDAAFLRHNPRMSNYDQILKATNENIIKDVKAGNLKVGEPHSRKISNPRYSDRYLIEYQTKDGGYAGTNERAKRDMLLKLEELFPGYIKAMQGEL